MAIGLIIFGIGKTFLPKYFRFYKTWEIFGDVEKPSRLELILDRIVGITCLLGGFGILSKQWFFT
ncbi:MAG: hypothetical protein ACYC4E_02770 [Carboxydocellales bacterium]